MRTLFFCLFLQAFLSAAFAMQSDSLKTAIVYYRFTNADKTLELVQYSTDYGNLRCLKYDIMGRPYSTIVTPDSIYEVSFALQSYQAEKRPYGDIDFNILTPELMSKFRIVDNGIVEYLNRDCQSYTSTKPTPEIKTLTVWVYQGIELRRITEYEDGLKTDMIATYIQENPEISMKTFIVPAGFDLFKK